MEDKNIDYLLKKYKINNYINDKSSDKFIENLLFLNIIKNKKNISLSDNNYIYDDCYPNYIYNSDTTNLKINNSIVGDFENLEDIVSYLDVKNNQSTSFVRSNKVTDLSYIKKMLNNSTQKEDLIYKKYTDINKKYIDSILLFEDSMNLTTLSYLKPDVIFDKDINKESNNKKYTINSYDTETTTLTLSKPLVGENRLNIDVSFDINGSVCPINGTNYRYKRIKFTPNFTGQYKVKLNEYVNFETNEYYEVNNYNGNYTKTVVYPDSTIDSYVLGSYNGNTFSTNEFYYLTKNIECIVHISYYKNNIIDDYQYPYSNIITSLYNDSEFLYLSTAEFLFLNNNINITQYSYLGNMYDITSISEKMSVSVLNMKTQLILFNTKDNIFTDNELYAIDKYCNLKLKFTNSSNPTLFKEVIKSIELKRKG